MAPPKLVILDRDGVINRDSDHYIKTLDEWVPYPAAIESIARLSHAGWRIAVATNQSGIARGYFDVATLDAMHTRLHTLVSAESGRIDHIAYCPHVDADGCDCRKPLPGLLKQIQKALHLESLEGCWMVGDSLRDLQAGDAVGCRSVLVRTGKGERTLTRHPKLSHKGSGTLIFDDLTGFVDWLLSASDHETRD